MTTILMRCMGVVLKVVRTEETAQDLLQEIFVKIWKNIAQYDASKGRLFTWMLNIARNTSIDYLRVNRLEIQDIDSAVYSVEQNQSIYDELTGKELREIVAQLKPEQQSLIEMVYWGAIRTKRLPNGSKCRWGQSKLVCVARLEI